jgi:hypothetical protein
MQARQVVEDASLSGAGPITPELEAVARHLCLALHRDDCGRAPTWRSLDDRWTDFLVEARVAIEGLLTVSASPEVRSFLIRAVVGAPAREVRTERQASR